MIWIIFIGIAVVSYIVQANLKNKFNRYSQEPLSGNLTGRDVAVKMLHDNGIYDVQVTSTPGMLTDHYNPANKTVNLSEGVFNSASVAAAAVAAHECGHAVQHAKAYSMLQLRSSLVPIVNFSSQIMSWVLLAGILLVQTMPQILLVGIVLFATTTLFSFVTLPVEIDASRRALQWLNSSGITFGVTHSHAQDALRSAAYTYVVAALGSLATLIYYVMIFLGSRRD
ncbi:MAG: zinc metallopeptidase [Bacteroidales bacterium]|nr:zinc metallopeptidase [Bacteroidales bacterium]